MATIDFPNSPAVNDTFTAGTVSYKWTGTAWISNNAATFDWDDITGKPATFPPSSHTHPISDVTNLQTALDGKAASVHTHAISDVTSLQTALDGKAALSHTHTKSQITDFAHTHTLSQITDYTPPVIPEVTFTNTLMLMGA